MGGIMEYFRYIFLIFILTGSTSIGFLLSKSYIERLNELKSLQNAVSILQNKIRFTCKPLIEIFEELAVIKKNEKISEIFKKMAEKLKNKKTEVAWNEAVLEERFYLNLKAEDINLILSLGNMLGKTDVEGQMSEINQFCSLINEQIVIAEEEKNKNSKMYKSLGTIIGLAIVIILF